MEKDPEAGMESPKGEEILVPPVWKDVYGGAKFEVRSLFPPFTWLPAYIRFLKGNATAIDTEKMGELPYSAKGDLIAGLAVLMWVSHGMLLDLI